MNNEDSFIVNQLKDILDDLKIYKEITEKMYEENKKLKKDYEEIKDYVDLITKENIELKSKFHKFSSWYK
jgi:predicted nuclease with TOPRIM domain